MSLVLAVSSSPEPWAALAEAPTSTRTASAAMIFLRVPVIFFLPSSPEARRHDGRRAHVLSLDPASVAVKEPAPPRIIRISQLDTGGPPGRGTRPDSQFIRVG